MAHKIQLFDLEDGSKIAVEVRAEGGEEERIANTRDAIVEETGRKFGDALVAVQQAAGDVLKGFKTALDPSELELTFGLKFSGKVGVVLASSDAEATLCLKAKWVKAKGEES